VAERVLPENKDKSNGHIKQHEEETDMTKTMKIEGMMCPHCEARVKKALEELDGVTEAIVSHKQDQSSVFMDMELSDDILKKAVEDQDYTVVSIS